MQSIEKPGVQTPWPSLNQLLSLDERYSVVKGPWQGFLFAPKTLAKLSALLFNLQELQLSFHVQGKGTSTFTVSSQVPIIVSTAAFKHVEVSEDSIVEIGAGCDLRMLENTLFGLGCEVGLEDWIWRSAKGTVGSAVLRGTQAGLVLRQTSIQERLLGIEWAKSDGTILKWGRAQHGASTGPALHHLFWGLQHTEGILTKVSFKAFPTPPIRLCFYWKFHDRQALSEHVNYLRMFTCSWERLDYIIPGNSREKAFVIAQISGIEEEIEAFKILFPSFTTAFQRDIREELKSFLLKQELVFHPIHEPDFSIASDEYIWYHGLINQGWQATPRKTERQQLETKSELWKERFLFCLKA